MAIAEQLSVNRKTVMLWRQRFWQQRLDGLWQIAPGRGRKPSYDIDKIAAIVDATLQTKPEGMTHWSCRTMAKSQGVSKSTVNNIWQAHNLKPHRVETFKLLQGKVIGRCYQLHRHQEFLKFLRTLDKEFPGQVPLHLVMDNYGTHNHGNVQNWLKRHPRFALHFVPTSSSWLNLAQLSQLDLDFHRDKIFCIVKPLIICIGLNGLPAKARVVPTLVLDWVGGFAKLTACFCAPRAA